MLYFCFGEIFLGINILLLLIFGLVTNTRTITIFNTQSTKIIFFSNIIVLVRFACLIIFITLSLILYQWYLLYFLDVSNNYNVLNINMKIDDFYFAAQQLKVNSFIFLCKILILFFSFIYFVIVGLHYKFERIYQFEFVILILICIWAFLIGLMANNFIIIYLVIEIQGIATSILLASNTKKNASVESGLKYYVFNAVGSGFFVMGISFIYLAFGSLNYNIIYSLLLVNNCTSISIIGFCFIFSGFLFKLGVVPFHLWLVDVYEGGPTLVIAFLTIITKLGVCFIFFLIIYDIFPYTNYYFQLCMSLLTWIGIITVIIGLVGAIFQTKLRSLFAYSSIVMMGNYLLLISFFEIDINHLKYLVLLYLFVYSITMSLIFNILLNLRYWTGDMKSLYFFYQISGLSKFYFPLSVIFAIALFSLMGLPPFLGFFIKFYVLTGFIKLEIYLLCCFYLLCGVVSVFYYLRLIKLIFFDKFNTSLFLTPIKFSNYLFSYILIFFLLLIIIKFQIIFLIQI